DGHRAVTDDMQVDAGRDRALYFWNFGADLPHHLDDIGTRLALDVDDDGRRALVPAAGAIILEAIDNDGDVADGDGRTVAIGDDDRIVSFGRRDLVVGGDGVGLLRAVEGALRAGDVGARNRVAQILHRDAVGGEPREVSLHAHGRLEAAENRDAADA